MWGVQWGISMELDQIRLSVTVGIRKGRTGSVRTCTKRKIYLSASLHLCSTEDAEFLASLRLEHRGWTEMSLPSIRVDV